MRNYIKAILALVISIMACAGYFFLVSDTQFNIQQPMIWLFWLSMILTLFLLVFFILNLKPDPFVLVNDRIKHLRENLFEQLFINIKSNERAKWTLELEQRRDEIRSELKRNLKLTPCQETELNRIIDKSWDELLAVIKSGSSRGLTAANAQTIEEPQAKEADNTKNTEYVTEAEEIYELEEADEFKEEEAAEVEELEEMEEADDEINETIEYEVEEIEINEADETPVNLPNNPENTAPVSGMFSQPESQSEGSADKDKVGGGKQ
ncbi:MAG: hypothetical protein FWC06_05735 [Treponema sp.]|nr:hypothetical protein [Treponema sp.]